MGDDGTTLGIQKPRVMRDIANRLYAFEVVTLSMVIKRNSTEPPRMSAFLEPLGV